MKWLQYFFASIFVLFLFSSLQPEKIYADLTECSVSISPESVATGSTTDYSVSLTNRSSDDSGDWIQLYSPGGEFVINSVSVSGWTGSNDESVVTLTDGSLGPSESVNFSINVTANSPVEGASWGVVMANSPDGSSGVIDCDGSRTANVGDPGDSSPIHISGGSIVASSTTATATWSTDVPGTTVIEYGTTDALGSTQSSTDLTTSHSITISGLLSSTTYYYRLKSLDAGNNEAVSGTSTFTTSSAGSTTTTTSTTTSSSTSSKPTPTPTLPPDVTPPSVGVNYNFTKPVAVIPIIRGSVTDDRDISSIEYSIDGGINWHKATFTPSSQKTIFYSFTPPIKEDGNFVVLVRAKDKAGNTGASKRNTLIFDRIPPKIGGSILTTGSQIKALDSSGVITIPSHVRHSLLFTSIGGAIDITVVATSSGKENGQKYQFKAKKNPTSSVWSSDMLFEKSGDYNVTIIAVDGADNRTETKISNIHILESGRVVYQGKGKNDVIVTVFIYDEAGHSYKEWKGESYLQQNPRRTDESGRYSFTLPKGMYYLSIEAKGFKRAKTNIFTLHKTTTINSDLEIQKLKTLKIGLFSFALPSLVSQQIPLTLKTESSFDKSKGSQVVGQKVKNFTLNSEGKKITERIFTGKKTIIGITNTFLPQTQVVIENINAASYPQKIVLFPHESDSYVQTYKKRGKYDPIFLADPDGDLFDFFKTSNLPAYISIDEQGIVKNINTGVFSNESVLK